MCYFNESKVKSNKQVLKHDAVIGYKVFRTSAVTDYRSVYQGTYWHKNRLIKTNSKVEFLYDDHPRYPIARTGIFAFKRKKAALLYMKDIFRPWKRDRLVVMPVKLYGNVVEFDPRHSASAGYLATKAEIIVNK